MHKAETPIIQLQNVLFSFTSLITHFMSQYVKDGDLEKINFGNKKLLLPNYPLKKVKKLFKNVKPLNRSVDTLKIY